MKKFLVWIIGLFVFISVLSCAPLVKTDLKSFNEDPEKYRGKEVIFTTDLKGVVENPTPYLGRKIELTGYVHEYGFIGFGHWNFMLKDEEGRSVRCYERKYRVDAWIMPVLAVRRAEKNNEQVTVVGKLQQGLKIELDWVEYKGQKFDTDFKPPDIPINRGLVPSFSSMAG